MKRPIALTMAAFTLLAAAAFAADAPQPAPPTRQELMDRMAKAAVPGPQHELLTRMAGEWTRTVTTQMNPSKPAQVSPGTASIVVLLDGRFTQETVEGNFGGMPYHGMGIFGFDNASGHYVSTLIDNMGTGFMNGVGTIDSTGKVIRWDATMNDPATGKPSTMRMVTTVTDDDHHTVEMFTNPGGDKAPRKLVTVEYVRKH